MSSVSREAARRSDGGRTLWAQQHSAVQAEKKIEVEVEGGGRGKGEGEVEGEGRGREESSLKNGK